MDRQKHMDGAIEGLDLSTIRDRNARKQAEREIRLRVYEHTLEVEDLGHIRDDNDRELYFRNAQSRLRQDIQAIMRRGLEKPKKARDIELER